MMKALIVDDEIAAQDVLENLLNKHCTDVDIMGKCSDLPSAVEQIKILQPDVVFLDIEMPNYAGYEIVHLIDTINFEIIFVTAYNQYALKAFEVSALDYLLKPLDIDRLKESVNRLEKKVEATHYKSQLDLLAEAIKTESVKRISVLDKGVRHIIDIDSIVAVKGEKSYSTLMIADGNEYLLSKNLKQIEALLEGSSFVRSHKSWIVNINFLASYSKVKSEIYLKNDVVAKLSRYKFVEFEALLKNR